MWSTEVSDDAVPIGYKKLVDQFNIKTLAHFRWSYVSMRWEKKECLFDHRQITLHFYPPSYRLPDDIFAHLEFAIKHEGVNLLILKQVFSHLSSVEVLKYILTKPTGKYAKIIWFLYENLMDTVLSIPDIKRSSYVMLLNSEEYYCGYPRRSQRHRVVNNLLGDFIFSPTVRKTGLLEKYEKKQLDKLAFSIAEQSDPELMHRAMRYLYTKETMSSWEIEKEKPSASRLATFISFLSKADSIGMLSEKVFVNLQKEIVDHRFCQDSYRDFQNYVGEEPGLGKMILHYIAPKPEDVRTLMNGLLSSFNLMKAGDVHPVIIAAVIAFSFVFIHPFEDGNGRIHRFLIHYVLSSMHFSPPGIIFPVSAAIVRDHAAYDRALEIFSKSLMELITQFNINDIGEMVVTQETCDYYRYIDFTAIAEYLFNCVDKTISVDFRQELKFLVDYDRIKSLLREIVNMPDQKIDLFIKCVRQNGGLLSARKRESCFPMLTDEEISQMQRIVANP